MDTAWNWTKYVAIELSALVVSVARAIFSQPDERNPHQSFEGEVFAPTQRPNQIDVEQNARIRRSSESDQLFYTKAKKQANFYRNKSQEYLGKSRQLRKSGKVELAEHYLILRQEVIRKKIAADKIAALKILEYNNARKLNSVLDSHGLYVEDAIPTVGEKLQGMKLTRNFTRMDTAWSWTKYFATKLADAAVVTVKAVVVVAQFTGKVITTLSQPQERSNYTPTWARKRPTRSAGEARPLGSRTTLAAGFFEPNTHRPNPTQPTQRTRRSSESNQSYFLETRQQANIFRQNGKEYLKKSRQSRYSGNLELARHYSKLHQKEVEKSTAANKIAAIKILEHNNAGRGKGVLDLHGLYVKEAIAAVEDKLARMKSDEKLEIITGRGVHSKDGAKIKPAIINYLNSRDWDFSFTESRGYVTVSRKLWA